MTRYSIERTANPDEWCLYRHQGDIPRRYSMLAHDLTEDEAKACLGALQALHEPQKSPVIMVAVVRRSTRPRSLTGLDIDVVRPGEMAFVEVPNNCTIHDDDAVRLIRTVDIAKHVAKMLRDGRAVGWFDGALRELGELWPDERDANDDAEESFGGRTSCGACGGSGCNQCCADIEP